MSIRGTGAKTSFEDARERHPEHSELPRSDNEHELEGTEKLYEQDGPFPHVDITVGLLKIKTVDQHGVQPVLLAASVMSSENLRVRVSELTPHSSDGCVR